MNNPQHPRSTLAIILGASEFPFGKLDGYPEFGQSAERFRNYLLDPGMFGLPEDNLLNLFDSGDPVSQLDEKVRSFLIERAQPGSSGTGSVADILVYYVGHGGFDAHRYFLALRDTRSINPFWTSYPADRLAATLKGHARHVRKYIILDSCFAAAAHDAFLQGGSLDEAVRQVIEAVQDVAGKGTALLCAASRKVGARARTQDGGQYTMFSGAFLDVLENGSKSEPVKLSLRTVGTLTRALIMQRYQQAGVAPEVHVPEQSEGDIATTLALFPNLAFERTLSEPDVNAKHKSMMSTAKRAMIIVRDTVEEVLRADPKLAHHAIVASDGQQLKLLDYKAEHTCETIFLEECGETVRFFGEEMLKQWEDAKAEVSRDKVCALADPIDGTDLLELGISLWCSAVILFDPVAPQIIGSVVSLCSGETYVASHYDPVVHVYRPKRTGNVLRRDIEDLDAIGGHIERSNLEAARAVISSLHDKFERRLASVGKETEEEKKEEKQERVTGPSKVTKLRDARICYYGQKAKNCIPVAKSVLFRKVLPEFVREEQSKEGKKIGFRLYNFAGNPLIVRLIDRRDHQGNLLDHGFDAVFEHAGQKPHDVAPGAYIALRAGAHLCELDGTPITETGLAEKLRHPNRRISYVLASTKALADELRHALRAGPHRASS